MEETHIPDFAKSKDILLFNYIECDKPYLDELVLDRPIRRDERLVKFLYYISTGNRIRYNRFDKEKGCYDGYEDTNFSTLHDRLVKGELNLVCPLDNIVYVFGEIAKMCVEGGIEYAIKKGRVSYKKGGEGFPPVIFGRVGRREAYINVLDEGISNSTFEFDLEEICGLIRIRYLPDRKRSTPVTRRFSELLKGYMKEMFPKKIKLFDDVFEHMLGQCYDDDLEYIMKTITRGVAVNEIHIAVMECDGFEEDYNEN